MPPGRPAAPRGEQGRRIGSIAIAGRPRALRRDLHRRLEVTAHGAGARRPASPRVHATSAPERGAERERGRRRGRAWRCGPAARSSRPSPRRAHAIRTTKPPPRALAPEDRPAGRSGRWTGAGPGPRRRPRRPARPTSGRPARGAPRDQRSPCRCTHATAASPRALSAPRGAAGAAARQGRGALHRRAWPTRAWTRARSARADPARGAPRRRARGRCRRPRRRPRRAPRRRRRRPARPATTRRGRSRGAAVTMRQPGEGGPRGRMAADASSPVRQAAGRGRRLRKVDDRGARRARGATASGCWRCSCGCSRGE